MLRFRKKSSSATPTNKPPPTPREYIKEELAKFHPQTKDQRALAAFSSAVALSIASPSCDPTDTALNQPGLFNESVWGAAYGAARMAVDVASASSDMFLPLKAVAGALSVLIKNYDQTTANVDQIEEIEGRIQSLGVVLTYPVGDQDSEEMARREVLRMKLADIVARLRPLAEQHGLMRFLKNVDHASSLNSFAKELAYAITDYQTLLQQSTHENTKRIDEATLRVDNTTNKIYDTAHRMEGTTNKINMTTLSIDETTKKIDETTRKIDESTQNIIEIADLELLGKLEPVRDAGYQAGHHETCLRGTRESVIDGITQWAKDPEDRHVFWLNGLAGTGKSTIAQTFSAVAAKTGLLGASFFCSRDYLNRRELKNIFPTLAYQLACRYPTFRYHIIRALKQDPSVASNSLISQLEELIVGPLSSSNISCVIVVDALDECIDNQPASAILSVLGRHVKQLQSVKFFITGRPEPRIRTGFRLPLLEPFTQIFLLHEVNLSQVDEDIRLYLLEKLTAVPKGRSDLDLPNPWPCGKDVMALTKKSSGLFIFASTLVRFIESEHHEPNERLQLIVSSSDSTAHEGRAGIDPLYNQILVQAFWDVKDTIVFKNLRRVLGAVVMAFNPLSRGQIAGILGVSTSLITRSLRHLHSVLLIPAEDSKEIRVFHKSFPDFLQDRDRCSDPKFFIDSSIHHGSIALDCLELLKKLKPNPCNLPDFVMNQDVVNLVELLEFEVGGATRYACGYWAMHVRSSPTTNEYAIRLISSSVEFFKSNVVPWVEVMSLENRLETVVHSIHDLLHWLGMVHVPTNDLRSLAQDCLRFTMHFFHPIQQSASHVYHSALPLSPTPSMFHSRTLREKTKVAGFYGRPEAWGAVLRTITTSYKRSTCVTTFGHKVAIACDDGTVAIYDSVTGVLRLSLRPSDPIHAMRGSQDGSLLFCVHQSPLATLWDIQTGGLIHTFALEHSVTDIAISLEGRYLACGLSGNTAKIWEVATMMECAPIGNGLQITHLCWLDPEGQLAVTIGSSVHIWDVVSAKALRRFTLLDPTIFGMVYSQRSDQLVILTTSRTGSAVNVVHPLQGLPSTHGIRQLISCFAISQTTNQLICGTETTGLEIFDISTQRWNHFEYPSRVTFVSSLPNGTVVTGAVGSGIQVLSLDDEHTASQQLNALTVHAFDEGRIIAILPASRDGVVLLEVDMMLQSFTIPAHEIRSVDTDRIEILCASLENHMAVHCAGEGFKGYLQLWEFYDERPKWTVRSFGRPSIGRISPFGTRLVTYDVDGNCISVWVTENGRLDAQLHDVGHTNPFDITFDSETQFYFHYDTCRIHYEVSSGSPRSSITLLGELPLSGPLQKRYYDVDDAREWVVGGSKRICWIPPGYIGSDPSSYCWAGDSLVMAGQDRTLRKLTFEKISEGSDILGD